MRPEPPASVRVPIDGPLTEGRFLERPSQFVVRAELSDGSSAAAHLPDPGRLEELLVHGRRLWLRPAAGTPPMIRNNPRKTGRRIVPKTVRKTKWTAVLVETPDGSSVVSLDTTLPNRLIRRALEDRALDELGGWDLEKAEHTVDRSRFDFLLSREPMGPGPHRLLLEVKGVTLAADGVARFPDAVTARGARHVTELAALTRSGDWQAAVLFVVQRTNAQRVVAATEIDPNFAEALDRARSAGVRLLARRCHVDLRSVSLGLSLPVG